MLIFRLSQRRYTDLYNEYFDYACQFIWRITKDQDITEEIVQLSFIKLFKSLKKFREDSSLKTYFTRILINTFYDEVKRKKSELISMDEAKPDVISDAINESDVESYIEAATPMQRACLVLFYQDGYSISEIATMIDSSEGTVKSHLSRGRAAIKQQMLSKEADNGI